jgi:putative transcriptional regulator
LRVVPSVKKKVYIYEQLGGDLIDISRPVDVDIEAKSRLLETLHAKRAAGELRSSNIEPIEDLEPLFRQQLEQADQRLPKPLRRFVPSYYEHLEWSGISKSIQSYDLPFSDKQYTARFYKIAAGKELPQHTHRGNEFTLVLSGSFSDLSGDYHPGDFVLANSSTHHQPKAHDKEDCICFAVMDAPLKMTGFFGRLLNPFLK